MPKKTLPLLLVLLLLSPALLRAAAPVAVTGTVSGPGGSPVQGGRALLLPLVKATEAARLELEGKADPEPVATAAIGADGSFRLQAPEAGMWKVAVQAQGMVPREILLQPLLEETELPALKLEKDVKLEVRAAGPDGKPLAGVRVRAGEAPGGGRMFRSETMRWRSADRMAVTDARGVAVLPRDGKEHLLVLAGATGQPFAEQKEVRGSSVSFRFPAGTAREIRVLDASGKKAVPGVWVQVGDGRWTAGRTSEDGRFAVPLAPKRKERLFLLAEDGRRLESYAEPPKKGEEGPKVLLLANLETLSGRVVSLADGRPVAGALVWNIEPAEAQRTGADGVYKLAVVPGRDAWLQAAASGFLTADAQVGVQPGLRRGPTLGLEPALAATGVVVDEQGRPVPGVQIEAAPLPNRMRSAAMFRSGSAARSSATGRFRLPGLVAGVGYDLKLSKTGFAPGSSEIPPLQPGRGASDLRIVLRKGRIGFGRVVDRSEQPVAGARVELRQAPSGDMRAWMRRMRSGANPRYQSTADATGRFEVRDLPAGTFELTARGSGFAPLTVPGLSIPQAGGGSIDLGTVVLGPGVEIQGYAVDPDGRPVEGAEIRVHEAAADPMARFFSQDEDDEPAAVSAQDGFFRVRDRRAGEVVDLDANRAGYAPAVASGVEVPAEPPVRLVLRPSAAVEGRTVDPDGKPVSGTRVTIFPSDPLALGGMRSFGAARARQAISDETGFFRVEDVIPGSFELMATAAGYQRSELKNLEVRPGQDLRGTEVVLAPGAVVEGRVLSPSGQPLAGAEVGMMEPSADFFFGTATTDGDGRYRLEGIAPGPRSFQAEHESYRRAVKELEVRLGENTLDLRLEGGAEISGRVVDEGGVPVPSARVFLRDGPRSWGQPGAVSGADGSFRLEGVADGTYRIQADKEGFAHSRDGVEVTVAGSSVSGVEVKLSAGGAIVGQITGVEFADLAKVQVWLMSNRRAGQVLPDGSYRIDHVEPGEHRVTASLPGGSRQAEGEVTLEPGAPEARLDLEFEGGLTLSGRVLRNGEAAGGLSVMASGPGLSRHGETDHQGRFRFEGLDAGTYELQVYGFRSGSRHRESVDLSDDRDVLIELQTVAVSGRVVDAEDQRPIPNAQVLLMAAQPEDTAPWQNTETTTDSRGLFRLRDVAEGSWKLRAQVSGYAPEELDVQVDSNRPLDGLEMALQATEGVVLEVLLPSGRPPDMVHTAVFDPSGRVVAMGSYPAGEDGRVRVASVAPGTWDLFLDADGSATTVVPVTAPGNAGRVILQRPGALRLQVAGLEDRAGAKVTLTDANGNLYRVPWGGQVRKEFELSGGMRRFDKLAPGQWTVTVAAPDGRSWSGSATVLPGATAEVTLE